MEHPLNKSSRACSCAISWATAPTRSAGRSALSAARKQREQPGERVAPATNHAQKAHQDVEQERHGSGMKISLSVSLEKN